MSLDMNEELRDGKWFVWVVGEDPSAVQGEPTWEDGYRAAVRRKNGLGRSGK